MTLVKHGAGGGGVFFVFDCEPYVVGHEKYKLDSLICSSPRKSLVKGERFIRCEEKPEMRPRDSKIYFSFPTSFQKWLT